MAEVSKSPEEIKTIITTLRNQGTDDKDMGKALSIYGITKEEAMPFLKASEKSGTQDISKRKKPEAKKEESGTKGRATKSLMDENGLFKAFTETVPLPSRGFFYKNGKDEVEVKHLTATEDDILFSPDLIKQNMQLHAILDSAIIDPDLNASDMLTGDRNYILVQLRRTGFGDDYMPGPMACNSCNHVYSPTVDLSKLKMKEIQYKPDENGEFAVELPFSKTGIKFRLLTGKDEEILNNRGIQDISRSAGDFKVEKVWTEKYLLQIMEVKGIEDKTLIKSFIDAMPLKDSKFFREYVAEIESGIDLNYNFKCPSCNTVETRMVPINMRLFYPDAEV
jgi:hypothetical protein